MSATCAKPPGLDRETDLGQVGADVGRLALADEAQGGAESEIARMDERLAEAFVGGFELEFAVARARDVDIGADAELVRARPRRRELGAEDDARTLFAAFVLLRLRRNGGERSGEDGQEKQVAAKRHTELLVVPHEIPRGGLGS